MDKSEWPHGVAIANGVEREFLRVDLGDRRRNVRCIETARELGRTPWQSLPKALRTRAALDGAYDLLSNPRVTFEALLTPHARETLRRMEVEREVLMVHDTTEFAFTTDRDGLGRLSSKKSGRRGFFFHVSLAVTADVRRLPLGVAWANTYAREGDPKPRRNGSACARSDDREADRWWKRVDELEAMYAHRSVSMVHLMDREADSYVVLSAMQGRKFVIRAAHDRHTEDGDGEPLLLSEVCETSSHLVALEVPISPRSESKHPGAAKSHPPRKARMAKLEISSASVTLRCPDHLKGVPETLRLNVVYAKEVDVPVGSTPVSWVLHTSEPVDTPEAALRVVEWYRARWTVEEYFKAIKSGCTIESLQLESLRTIANALALYIPTAYLMLALRTLARTAPDVPATQILSPSQIALLHRHYPRLVPPNPTAAEALLGVASLGGFARQNKKTGPGWRALADGVHDLMLMDAGWHAARGDVTNL